MRVFTLILGCAMALTVSAQPADLADEAGLVTRLTALREDIAKAEKLRGERKTAVDRSMTQLRAVEKDIGERNRKLKALALEISAAEARMIELQAEQVRLETDLSGEKSALAALLRSAYVLGRLDTLKLVLAQDQMSDTGRLLAYSTQLQNVRVSRIDRVRNLLAALAKLKVDTEAAANALAIVRQQESENLAALAIERQRRASIVKELRAELAKVESKIEDLGKDRHEIEDLLAKLRDVIGDVPSLLPQDRPFAESRGHLARPVAGGINIPFGQQAGGGRASAGVLIAADTGTQIRAVARGRVAFADWLRGYGLLMILDHGDGYMSLYGRCESLNKTEGDWVEDGQVLATVGDSGGSGESGLYFELRHRGQALDPAAWWAQK